MLLQLGIKPDDKRRYTNTDQIRLLLDELQLEEASSIQVEIIQSLQCVQVDQRPAFMELLPGKLKKPQYSLVKASLSALFQLGDAGTPGLVETRALLVAPAKANPGMIEELRQDAPDEWPELVAKLRGEAAMARIALGALADDVALYPELDEEGQAAAARGVLMLLGCGCRTAPVGAKVNDQVKAVTFAIDFYATPERVSEMPNEAIGWLARLAVPPTDPLLRAKAIDGLKKVLEVHPDPVIRDQIRTGLERIRSLPNRSQP